MSKIQKAVSEIKSIEELANEDRWVNQVHPLVKLCVTILYIGTVVSFSKYNLSGLLVMAVYPVILFIMNDISVKDALWRMRVVLPLVCVAGIFNPFFDRQAVMTVGQKGIHFKVWGSLMGQMLLRSMDRAEVIYESMCLRGFDGVFRLKKEIRFCARDAVYLVLWIVIFAVLRYFAVGQMIGTMF